MPRYDLVDGEEQTVRYRIFGYSYRKEQRRRRLIWGLVIAASVALLAFIGLRNPALVRQAAELPATLAEAVDTQSVTSQTSSASTLTDEATKAATAAPTRAATATATVMPTATSAATATAMPQDAVADESDEADESNEANAITSNNPQDDDQATPDSEIDDEQSEDEQTEEPSDQSDEADQPVGQSADVSNPVAYSGLLLETQEGALTVVGPDGASVLNAPDGDLLSIVTPGSPVVAQGRTDSGEWILLTTDKAITGWVAADSLMLALSGIQADTLPTASELATNALTGSGSSAQVAQALSQPATVVQPTTVIQPTAVVIPTVRPTATIRPSSTPSPTPIPTPTFTPTFTPAPTPSPVPTAAVAATDSSQVETVFAVVRSQGATLREEPEGDIVRSLRAGFTLNAFARSEDSAWLLVETTETDEAGWVGVDRVVAFRINTLPVVDPTISFTQPPTAAALPTDAASSTLADNNRADNNAADSDESDSDESDSDESDSDESDSDESDSDESDSDANDNADIQTDTLPAGESTDGTPRPIATLGATVTPRPTATPRPTPINSEGYPLASISVTDGRLNIRNGPDSTYQIIDKAIAGEQFVVLARSEDAAWVQIEVLELAGAFGWVSADFVTLTEAIEGIPFSNQVNFDAPAYAGE